jgi:uncharacterized SAM-binding protein YcdF (DUF218 family)
MLYLIKYVYSFFIPPGLFISVLIALSIGLYKKQRTAAKLLWAVTCFIYLFTTPLAASVLLGSLEHRYSLPAAVQGDVIVVLGGGAIGSTPDVDGIGSLTGTTLTRVVAAYKLHKKTGLPIIVSGGQVFKDSGNEARIAKRYLLSLGLPESAVIAEDKSRNTKENAAYTLDVLKQKGFTQPILVTSASHMPRAAAQFNQLNVQLLPYPVGFLVSQPYPVTISSFLPSADALLKNSLAAKEYLGQLEQWF